MTGALLEEQQTRGARSSQPKDNRWADWLAGSPVTVRISGGRTDRENHRMAEVTAGAIVLHAAHPKSYIILSFLLPSFALYLYYQESYGSLLSRQVDRPCQISLLD
uniref:Uncharacterized protein n=1 Tax=Plectus sambesii TaxID=2011161 RepID=A0A914WH39_9BILA